MEGQSGWQQPHSLDWPSLVPRHCPDGRLTAPRSCSTVRMRMAAAARPIVISSMGGTPHRLLPEDRRCTGEDHKLVPRRTQSRFLFRWRDTGIRRARIRILDLNSHQVSILPGSQGMYSPRWSPNGRLILALDTMSDVLKVFDFQTQRWSVLTDYGVGWLAFSRDGRFIYFTRSGDDPGVYRIRTSGGKAERVVDLKGFHTNWGRLVRGWGSIRRTSLCCFVTLRRVTFMHSRWKRSNKIWRRYIRAALHPAQPETAANSNPSSTFGSPPTASVGGVA